MFPDVCFCCADFLEKFTGGEYEASFAADDDLLETVGGCHTNPAVRGILMGETLYIAVGGFRLFCKDDVQVMVIEVFLTVTFYPIGVIYDDDFFIPEAPIV